MKLNREHLLSRSLRRQEIDLPDLDGTVTVRELSAAEVGDYLKRHKAADSDDLTSLAWVVVKAVCDDAGKPIFSDADLEAVKGMGLRTVKALAEAVAKLSGLTDDAHAKDAKKKPGENSVTIHAAASPSA